MINLTDEMKQLINDSLANGMPCIVATASASGQPGVGYKGSMMAFDHESLAYWERVKRAAFEHVGENAQVVVMFRDTNQRKAWKFFGRAIIYSDGPIREEVMNRVVKAELDRDPDRLGLAVVIKIDRIITLGGELLQDRQQD